MPIKTTSKIFFTSLAAELSSQHSRAIQRQPFGFLLAEVHEVAAQDDRGHSDNKEHDTNSVQ